MFNFLLLIVGFAFSAVRLETITSPDVVVVRNCRCHLTRIARLSPEYLGLLNDWRLSDIFWPEDDRPRLTAFATWRHNFGVLAVHSLSAVTRNT